MSTRRSSSSYLASSAVPFVLAAVLALVLAAPPLLAQEPAPEAAAPEMTPEQAAEMAAWQKAGTPGPEHEKLASMAGDWSIEVRMWMEPGAEPIVLPSTAHREMILGGRVLVEEVEGEFMGAPFAGHAMSGYDNVTGKWWGTWVDNQSTGVMVSEGTWDAEGKVGTYRMSHVDPTTGEVAETKGITRILSADHEVHEMWEERDGESFKSMELEYRRK